MLSVSSRTVGPIVLAVAGPSTGPRTAQKAPSGAPLAVRSEGEALDLLRSLGNHPQTGAGLRELLRELEAQSTAPSAAGGNSDEEVLRTLAKAMAAGRLTATLGRLPGGGGGGGGAGPGGGGGGGGTSSAAPAAAPAPAATDGTPAAAGTASALGSAAPIATSAISDDPTAAAPAPWPEAVAAAEPDPLPPPSAAATAAAAASAAAASDAANTDAEAQAATLQEAAQNGTPFCEECERLAAAAAASAGGGSA